MATLRYGGFHLVPDTGEVLLCLQTVGIGHRCTEIGFHRRLERTHFEDLHLDTEFVHQAGVVHLLRRKSVPVNRCCRVEIYLVCHRSHIVVGLPVVGRIGDNPFARGLEIEQRITQGLCTRRCHRERPAVEVDTQNTVIVFGKADIVQQVVQTDGLVLVVVGIIIQQSRKRIILLSLLYEGSAQFQFIHRVCLQLGSGSGEHSTHHITHPCTHTHIQEYKNTDGP